MTTSQFRRRCQVRRGIPTRARVERDLFRTGSDTAGWADSTSRCPDPRDDRVAAPDTVNRICPRPPVAAAAAERRQ